VRSWLFLGLALVWAGTAQAQQAPGPAGAPEGAWRAQIHWVPLDLGGIRYLLQTRICRPAGEMPARVVVVAHGSPPSALARPGMKPVSCDSEVARWFLERGFVVVSGMRRGYGETGGVWAESYGSCGSADYVQAGRETARDLAAMVEYAASLPFARPAGIVVVGQSAGGWGSIAYNAAPHQRVTAFVNMAGGRGGHFEHQAGSNCRPDLLAEATGRLARSATTPMLWVYTENDSYFAPTIAAALYTAYTQNGGKAEFQRLGAFGQDGHQLFYGQGGSAVWGPLVERYLASRPAQ
jgi:dienelactone hydrolase